MTGFTSVFGGSPVSPAQVSYLALALTADTTLIWPLEALQTGSIAASIIDVTPTGAYSIIMPDATLVSTGTAVLFNNLGPNTVTVKDQSGNTLLSLASGTVWQLYLRDNSTANGGWRSFQFGASVSQAQASALAGYGLTPIGATLATATPVASIVANYTAGVQDRAKLILWEATGSGTLTLPTAASAGDNWFIAVRNGGGGALTIDPQGGDLINGAATLVLDPADSALVMCDGTDFFTVGYGQQAIFAFDFTTISLAGAGATRTLAGSELNRIAYKFNGVLSNDVSVVLPSTVQMYWVDNSTTGGSYLVKIGTLSQAPFLTVPRGSRGIYYCDGTNIIKADTASIATPIAISDGGTGANTANGALVNLGGTATGIALFTSASALAARTALSAAASGANSDITSLTALSTPLSVAQGGTGANSAAGARTALSAAQSGANSDITSLAALSTPLSVAQGGSGVATLTGLAKGNGATAFSAAVAGTDYAKPDTASAWTKKQTLNGGASELALALKNASEPATVSATAATGTVNFNLLTQSVLVYTSNAAANWTLNIRGDGSNTLDSLMAVGDVVTVTHVVPQGGTAYYNNVVQIDGTTVGVTTRWLGGAPTGGTINSSAVYSYVVIKTGAATFTVLASLASFT